MPMHVCIMQYIRVLLGHSHNYGISYVYEYITKIKERDGIVSMQKLYKHKRFY